MTPQMHGNGITNSDLLPGILSDGIEKRCFLRYMIHALKCQPNTSGKPLMNVEVVQGDLLDQPVDAIVNAWNRNLIPWWLLLPHGVSGAIKKCGGLQPFREVAKLGPIPLGQAVLTSAGTLPFKAIIHVAGIDGFWRASEYSIRHSVRNAVTLAEQHGFSSLAFPVIGSGAGSFSEANALELMLDELAGIESDLQIRIVEFRKQ